MLPNRWLFILAAWLFPVVDSVCALEASTLTRPIFLSPIADYMPRSFSRLDFGFQVLDAIIEEKNQNQHSTSISGIDYRLALPSKISSGGWSLRPSLRYRELTYEIETVSQVFDQDFTTRSSQELWETHLASEFRYTTAFGLSLGWEPELSSVHQKFQSSFLQNRTHFRYHRQHWSVAYLNESWHMAARHQTGYNLLGNTFRLREAATTGLDLMWHGERQSYGLRYEIHQNSLQDKNFKNSWLVLAGIERNMGPGWQWAVYGEYLSPYYKDDISARAGTIGSMGMHVIFEFLAYRDTRIGTLFRFNSASYQYEDRVLDFQTQRFQIQFDHFFN